MKKVSKESLLVNFILDETGSMQACKEATISGFNEYIKSLMNKKEKVFMTLTKFNSKKIEVVFINKMIKDIKELDEKTYQPDDLTPLYDAIGKTIKSVEKEKDERNVLCIIMTDGEENASKEYTRQGIFDLIKEKEKNGWTFVYLGANHDSWTVGQSIGLHQGNVASYVQEKIGETFSVLARATCSYSGQTNDYFSEKDREEIK